MAESRQRRRRWLGTLDAMTTTFRVHAIEPARLDAMRLRGEDEHGNPLKPYDAKGWEPLRCCLRRAAAGESIALIAYQPFTERSPWAEVGPVFIHADRCEGYDADAGLPPQQRTGPRILRTYGADGSLNYDHITLVPDGEDVGAPLEKVLSQPGVATVHVRAVMAQCFAYAVTR